MWDHNTGKLLNTLEGHSDYVEYIAITSDNSKIVSGSEDKTIKIWDVNTGKLLNTLKQLFKLLITSDNTRLVSTSYNTTHDTTTKVWDLNTGKLLNTLEGHSNNVNSVAITSDNSKIVSGSDDVIIKIWDLNTGNLLNTLEGHLSPVNCVAITSDNSKIVSGSYDKTIEIWDLNTGKLLNTLAHFGMVISQRMDGMIQVVYAEEFERPDYNDMVDTVLQLLEKYDVVNRVHVDGSFPAFIRSLKKQLGSTEHPENYDQLFKYMLHRSENRFTIEELFPKMKIIPVNFAKHHRDLLKHTQMLLEKEYLAINPKFDKLITSLRTAVANEYTLDKEAISFDDLLDAYRMSLRYYYAND